tara:strand:+ start:243 stop:587 length:345 start_codon:yes stop_codon:yes gene_type:complete
VGSQNVQFVVLRYPFAALLKFNLQDLRFHWFIPTVRNRLPRFDVVKNIIFFFAVSTDAGVLAEPDSVRRFVVDPVGHNFRLALLEHHDDCGLYQFDVDPDQEDLASRICLANLI